MGFQNSIRSTIFTQGRGELKPLPSPSLPPSEGEPHNCFEKHAVTTWWSNARSLQPPSLADLHAVRYDRHCYKTRTQGGRCPGIGRIHAGRCDEGGGISGDGTDAQCAELRVARCHLGILQRLLSTPAVAPHEVRDAQCGRAGDSRTAVHQHSCTVHCRVGGVLGTEPPSAGCAAAEWGVPR